MIDLVIEYDPPAGLTAALESSLAAVMRHFEVADREVTVVLVDDDTIQALKLEHWGEDAATDVLSFPAWEPGDPFMPPHLGDIIISLDTAARQAEARGHSLTREVALLASHGMTHLVGHDHPHAEGLGFEEGATGEEWQVFHGAWATAESALPEGV
ncbi:metalloprotease ybeY [Deinococcus proteolyticus MRP]|uniref:Endoribonuclease YbeY n=1 Tax=Deinococcus proteolyticus (strain ATCC 35074 / DSM 20540 / JCM 6276 / NBRC 101906 / NCIMB 13154 / VKM Ac-1939 / CCM 2703 / MRP) TaxID=693977 RepID=F0RLW1_DEIPM|nr:rRNA maturation RNase YbeY [Deinococcus proteolyticus]ADY26971.1 metalloprotease ybeY [Deinococcus proteolyticus MRP]